MYVMYVRNKSLIGIRWPCVIEQDTKATSVFKISLFTSLYISGVCFNKVNGNKQKVGLRIDFQIYVVNCSVLNFHIKITGHENVTLAMADIYD